MKFGSTQKTTPTAVPDGAQSQATDGGGSARAKASKGAIRAAILEHKRTFVKGEMPIMILPEGITHNGLSMLKFFPGSFEGGLPVQPVVFSYPFKYFNTHSFLSDLGTHLIKLLWAPYTSLAVTILPIYRPSEEEKADPELFAENVRRHMAAELDIPLSSYGAKDLREEWKASKAAM